MILPSYSTNLLTGLGTLPKVKILVLGPGWP